MDVKGTGCEGVKWVQLAQLIRPDGPRKTMENLRQNSRTRSAVHVHTGTSIYHKSVPLRIQSASQTVSVDIATLKQIKKSASNITRTKQLFETQQMDFYKDTRSSQCPLCRYTRTFNPVQAELREGRCRAFVIKGLSLGNCN
jgi:lipopolysaccharide biosynthesis regulator YciM